VSFGNVAASTFAFVSDSNVTATVPTGAVTAPIKVTTGNGTGQSSTNFTVTTSGGSAPTVTSFTPTTGPVGTSVSITGTGFTGLTGVSFGGVAAVTTHFVSDTNVTATVPTGAVTGHVAVSTGNGTGTSSGNFTVTTSGTAPKITSFYPQYGKTGALIRISGSGFTGATSVKLGGLSASFVVQAAGVIQVTVPAMGVGLYKWQVTTPGGTATSTGSFFHQ
jgi:IPT/TIG domain